MPSVNELHPWAKKCWREQATVRHGRWRWRSFHRRLRIRFCRGFVAVAVVAAAAADVVVHFFVCIWVRRMLWFCLVVPSCALPGHHRTPSCRIAQDGSVRLFASALAGCFTTVDQLVTECLTAAGTCPALPLQSLLRALIPIPSAILRKSVLTGTLGLFKGIQSTITLRVLRVHVLPSNPSARDAYFMHHTACHTTCNKPTCHCGTKCSRQHTACDMQQTAEIGHAG